jgi:hypothetical protein
MSLRWTQLVACVEKSIIDIKGKPRRHRLGDIVADKRIILKCVLKK